MSGLPHAHMVATALLYEANFRDWQTDSLCKTQMLMPNSGMGENIEFSESCVQRIRALEHERSGERDDDDVS